MDLAKDIIAIVQGAIIIFGTLFTVWWTYRAFGRKEKIEELRKLIATIEMYYQKVQLYAAQVRKGDKPDMKEIKEKLELVTIHNNLVMQANTNFFIRPKVRKKIQNIVGRWISNERLGKMRSPSEEAIERFKKEFGKKGRESEQDYGKSWKEFSKEHDQAWQEFNKEHDQVKEIIEKEASKYI